MDGACVCGEASHAIILRQLKAISCKLPALTERLHSLGTVGLIQKNLAKVSRVIYNRLARGMPLQMDSTVLYSLGQDGGPVTPADLQIKSPYNTYLNTGLTPTPICFPSSGALGAALHPATGAWIYFTLVSEDGTEAFSDTYAGQLAAEL